MKSGVAKTNKLITIEAIMTSLYISLERFKVPQNQCEFFQNANFSNIISEYQEIPRASNCFKIWKYLRKLVH